MQELVNLALAILPFVAFILLIRLLLKKLRTPGRIITDDSGLKKISTNPSIFGGAWRKSYYFDSQHLYEVDKNNRRPIPLADIVQIKPGYTTVNNRRSWEVIYRAHGTEKRIEFYPNLTLFNQNFTAFLLAVKQANPQAEVKEISFFSV